MKVLLLSPLPPPYGGIANWTKMMKDYVENIDDVDFSFLNTAPTKRSMEGRTLWDRVVVQGFCMFRLNKQMKKILKSQIHDAVHITTSAQLSIIRDIMLLKTAKKMGVPTVYHTRFGRIPDITLRNTLEWKLLKKAMKIADCVMVIDSASCEAVKKYAEDVNVCCVPNPFDMNKIQSIDISSINPKKEIVFVGWVIKSKGVEELLGAWQSTCKKYTDWTLRIVGPYNPAYKDELQTKYSFENVVFTGEKSNKETLNIVANSSIFILPSYTEGFPNAVVEAMALEKAIIGTKVGAIPDMLEGCGIVIEPMNVNEIERAFEKMLGDSELRCSLAKKAKQKMMREYTMETIFGVYKTIWNNLSKNG